MTHQTKKKIVLASIIAIVAAGLMALSPSTLIGNAQGQMYSNEYGYDNNYYQDDNNRYGYDKKDPKSSHVDIQKIKCVNSNINVNGIDITQIPTDDLATAEAANEGGADATGAQNGNGWGDRINFERNLVNICVNVNDNEQLKVSAPEEDGSPCEDCFSVLSSTQIGRLLEIIDHTSIGEYCNHLLDTPNSCQESQSTMDALGQVPNITTEQLESIFQCLVDTGVINELCM